MDPKTLERLEWPHLLSYLEDFCQTAAGKERQRNLQPRLTRSAILERWQEVLPLVRLLERGYEPVFGEILPIAEYVHALGIGQVLDGETLRIFLRLLEATQHIVVFAKERAEGCSTMASFAARLQPIPELVVKISRCIDPTGLIRDDASPSLLTIRSQKRNLRKRVESDLNALIKAPEVSRYLQDEFYTVRKERYVIPIKLDGRGRVQGTIISTSKSGETIFVEPQVVRQINEQLNDLDLSEKIEIHRIFKELSGDVAKQASIIQQNYDLLIDLDCLLSEAYLAKRLKAEPIEIPDSPRIDVRDIRHPLLVLQASSRDSVVPNTIELLEPQHVLVISGPNAGGKTVILKTLGLNLLMISAGLLPAAASSSALFLFSDLFMELGDTQDLSKRLSTFSGHLNGLKPVLSQAGPTSLALLDELCVGTEPHTGSALAQAILEDLASKQVWILTTTHYDSIKLFALNSPECRSAAMGFHDKTHSPTYKLKADLPGLSYGLELAEQVGIPEQIIQRAEKLRGESAAEFDRAIEKLNKETSEFERKNLDIERRSSELEQQKTYWQAETARLKMRRHELAGGVIEKYEQQLREKSGELEKLIKEYRGLAESSDSDQAKAKLRAISKETDTVLHDLKTRHRQGPSLPGKPAVFSELKVGDRLYVTPFEKVGLLIAVGKNATDKLEIEIGQMRIKVGLEELRVVAGSKGQEVSFQYKRAHKLSERGAAQNERPKTFIPTSTNQLDVRGLTIDQALDKVWGFMDSAILRGDAAVMVIHGHGTAQLKNAIRAALINDSPYDLEYRAGESGEGGDGVTIVFFR